MFCFRFGLHVNASAAARVGVVCWALVDGLGAAFVNNARMHPLKVERRSAFHAPAAAWLFLPWSKETVPDSEGGRRVEVLGNLWGGGLQEGS